MSSTLDVLLGDIRWHERAACRPSAVRCEISDWFIPTVTSAHTPRKPDWPRALRVCQPCPVKTDCADYAAEHHLHFGVWGGRLLGCAVDAPNRSYCHERRSP